MIHFMKFNYIKYVKISLSFFPSLCFLSSNYKVCNKLQIHWKLKLLMYKQLDTNSLLFYHLILWNHGLGIPRKFMKKNIHTILMIPMPEVGIKQLVTSPFLLGIIFLFGINLNVWYYSLMDTNWNIINMYKSVSYLMYLQKNHS